ncbi:MAG: hypothetical protein ACOH1I_08495 [Gallionellaceae bacterium]
MSRKILFFLSADNFHANIWKDGKLGAPYYFPHSTEGLQKFSEFLQEYRDPAYLLVDLIEEDFRQETVPHLTGSNYHALVARKFEQYYRSTPFRMARLQKRQSEGRRDDELLFSALTNAGRITAWLDLLLENKTPIAGIYSVPHISLPLVKDIDSDHLLLLTWEKDAGLRQTYFLDKQLRFSRLTPINPNSTFADTIATESERTQQYLHSLSLTPHGDLLNVHIICHAKDRAQLDVHLSSNKKMQYAYLDIQELAKLHKSKYQHTDSDVTPLFLHALASHPPGASYANSEQTHYYQLWQTQRGLFALSVLSALICLVWSTLAFLESSALNDDVAVLNQQANHMQQESRQITQKFPGTIQGRNGSNVSASDMKTVVTLLTKLKQYSAPPQQLLYGLSTTLSNFPRISTGKLSWQTAAEGNLPVQEITFNGELLDFGNDYRGALNYLERFQLVLARAGYSVTPIKLPLDFSSKGSINDDTNFSGEKPFEFSLKLNWRPQA